MAGYIEDRWKTKKPDPKTGEKRRTARWGKGKRWRVAGIPGVKDRSFTNLKGPDGAEKWLADSQTDTSRGQFYDPRDGNITLREYVEKTWWPNLRQAPGTKQSMKPRVFNHILPHVGSLPLNRIGSDEIKAWLMRVEQDIDVNTVRTTWRHFSSIMQAAKVAKKVPANPFRDPDLKAPASPPSKAKAWAEETVAAVRAELPARYRILLDLAVGAGLRQGECFAFSPDDIEGNEIHVRHQIVIVAGKLAFAPPKRGKLRDAPCPPELAKAVKEYANSYPTIEVTLPWVDPDRPSLPWEKRPMKTLNLLVTTPRIKGGAGGAISRNTFDDKTWKPTLVRAGVIPPPTVEYVQGRGKKPWARKQWAMPREDGFHALRHTFASIVLAAGETITQLAAWLGHSDPAFTLRTYTHFLPKSGSMGVAALGRWLSPGACAVPAVEAVGATEISTDSDSPQILPSGVVDQGIRGLPAGQ